MRWSRPTRHGRLTGPGSRGLDSLLLAPTRAAATSLNERARRDHLADATPGRSVSLADGTSVSAGDVIVTRRNDRRLLVGDTDWVKNGDRWRVMRTHRDGSLTAAPAGSRGRRVRLPAAYVAAQVQLGYAATVHSAPGMTVDTSHTLLDGSESRQLLYVALSRGRSANHLYTSAMFSSNDAGQPRADCPTPLDVLRGIVARDGADESAATAARTASDSAVRLHEEVLRYLDGIDLAAAREPVALDGLRPGRGVLADDHSCVGRRPATAAHSRPRHLACGVRRPGHRSPAVRPARGRRCAGLPARARPAGRRDPGDIA